jgi:cytochrome c oxidase subunit 4
MSGRAEDVAGIWRRVLPVWLALLGLLALTVIGAHLPLGPFNLVLALGIAAAKVVLVGLFFMHLRRPDPLLRLAASAATLWILFLFSLSFADLLTRPPADQPGVVEPRSPGPAGRSTGGQAF